MVDPEISSIKAFPTITHDLSSEEGSRVINEAVALKLGKPTVNKLPHQVTHGHRVSYSGKCLDGDCGPVDGVGYAVPDYCRSMPAAWEIVELLYKKYDITLDYFHGEGWRFCICEDEHHKWLSWFNMAPMAICIAFLSMP